MVVALVQTVATFKDREDGVDAGLREPWFAPAFKNGDDLELVTEEALQGVAVVHVQPSVGSHYSHASADFQEAGGVEKKIDVEVGISGCAKLDGSAVAIRVFARGNGSLETLLVLLVVVAEQLRI